MAGRSLTNPCGSMLKSFWGLAGIAFIATVCGAETLAENAALLPKDAHLAIAGDSITEHKLYSKFIETYLLACAGRNDVHVMQFGLGGETAGAFSARMVYDLATFKPDVVTTCYGMNDGGCRPYNDGIGAAYEKGMRAIVAGLTNMGVKTVVIGSPGAVDTRYYAQPWDWKGRNPAEGYNESLKTLRDIDEKIAKELSAPFADIHAPMVETMAKAKAALGADYAVCGRRDGIHPYPNGHLIMACAFLKTLGCDGSIGEIVLDMSAKKATASAGHKIISSGAGKVEIESSRYPFCFKGDAKSSEGARSILPYLPFNKELNRLVLKVKGLGSGTGDRRLGGGAEGVHQGAA